jgi:hypothetical protein
MTNVLKVMKVSRKAVKVGMSFIQPQNLKNGVQMTDLQLLP